MYQIIQGVVYAFWFPFPIPFLSFGHVTLGKFNPTYNGWGREGD